MIQIIPLLFLLCEHMIIIIIICAVIGTNWHGWSCSPMEQAKRALFRVEPEETEYSRAVSALRLEPQWDEVRQFSRLTIPMENPQDVVMFMVRFPRNSPLLFCEYFVEKEDESRLIGRKLTRSIRPHGRGPIKK